MDYAEGARGVVNVSIGLAVTGFIGSVIFEALKHRRQTMNSQPVIERIADQLATHVTKGIAASSVPVACALVYCAFDYDFISHLAALRAHIALSGLTLIITSTRTLLR